MPAVSYTSKKEMVYSGLRDAIVSGEITPGTRLIIDDIAAEHKISHIPVREALQMLTSEGFVSLKPHAGATVTDIDPRTVAEIFDILEGLEVAAGRAACKTADPEQIKALRSVAREMDAAAEDAEEWSRLNFEFHRMVCQAAGYAIALDLLERVKVHWDRVRRRYLRDVLLPNAPKAQKEHWRIIEAIEKGDPDLCEEIVRKHNRSARKAYGKHVKKNTNEGE